MSDFKDLEFTEIEPAEHRLPGIETIKYLFNREKSELVIMVNETEIAVINGEAAMQVRKKVTDSEYFSKSCPAKNECTHVQSLKKKLTDLKIEAL